MKKDTSIEERLDSTKKSPARTYRGGEGIIKAIAEIFNHEKEYFEHKKNLGEIDKQLKFKLSESDIVRNAILEKSYSLNDAAILLNLKQIIESDLIQAVEENNKMTLSLIDENQKLKSQVNNLEQKIDALIGLLKK